MIDSIQIKGLKFVPFINRKQIESETLRIAEAINNEYRNEIPVFIVILNGAFMFASDLLKKVNISCEVTFIKLKSYDGLSSKGVISELLGLETDLTGRNIIIVEDIIDSGRTMMKLLHALEQHNPNHISIATLLFKPASLKHELDIDFIGFEIPEAFVVGYGLDYDGLGRNLQDIYQLSGK